MRCVYLLGGSYSESTDAMPDGTLRAALDAAGVKFVVCPRAGPI
jgi:hypothetical protein